MKGFSLPREDKVLNSKQQQKKLDTHSIPIHSQFTPRSFNSQLIYILYHLIESLIRIPYVTLYGDTFAAASSFVVLRRLSTIKTIQKRKILLDPWLVLRVSCVGKCQGDVEVDETQESNYVTFASAVFTFLHVSSLVFDSTFSCCEVISLPVKVVNE